MEKPKTPKPKSPAPAPPSKPPEKIIPPPAPVAPPPLFRRLDWITFAVTTLLVFIGYFLTLSPNLTLEDSGELAVGSFYAGVPHPPGYPVWTIYTWLFTVLVPVSNIAWRVALSSAVAGALACGMLGLLVSRGSSMLLEGITGFKEIARERENLICLVSGFVAGMLLGFNGFMWSQAVIVEVYTFSVLSFMVVLCLLLRWIYAPHQRRYLYWAFFVFGICITNHQTLIVAAMGIEVAVLAAQPKLGRDLFFMGNTLIYLAGLFGKALGYVGAFENNVPLFVVYNVVGIASFFIAVWYTIPARASYRNSAVSIYFSGLVLVWFFWMLAMNKADSNLSNSIQTFYLLCLCGGVVALVWHSWATQTSDRIFSHWKPVLIMGALWLLGTAFYFYMPIASMTNPPMNWGYPRTLEGFKHVLTRGQYDKTNPTNDPLKFVYQVMMYFEGATEEFSLVGLSIGLLSFVFLPRMQRREKAWVAGLTSIYLCLAFLLLILLNPMTDRQSREQVRVFFTASHIVIAIAIGYGLTLIGGLVATQYGRARNWLLFGGAVAIGIELFYLLDTFWTSNLSLLRFAAVLGLCLALAFTLVVLFRRGNPPLLLLLILFAIIPARSILSNWSDNEQRGHLFGFWFGHDMFTPPFGVYPEMTKDAILFGGTDPGRFCPTYMIFCESFLPQSKRLDPNFDRRDVYVITQNALADGTYLQYIRAHYHRSAEIDPPFFSEFFHTRMLRPVDNLFLDLGAKIEKERRARGVYPPKEIYTPSAEDSQEAFRDYILDAQRRLQHDLQFPNEPKQIKPAEEVRPVRSANGEETVQVSGQVAVMAINALLTKVIFDKNPDHEFFVEESFPLDWMFPYLTPYGIIMKINRQPVNEITDDMTRKDHEFWSRYSERLIGNWITYDTPVKEICAFAERTFLHRDLSGFKGNPKFVRDDVAQKSFSKLRSAIGGLYVWHIANAKTLPDQQRMIKEADFALRQSFAFCPYSPEAVFKYASLLATIGRFEDAEAIVNTSLKFDSQNSNLHNLADQLRYMKENQTRLALPPPQEQPAGTTQAVAASTNLAGTVNLIAAQIQEKHTNEAIQLIDQVLSNAQADASALLPVAQYSLALGDRARLSLAIERLRQQIAPLEQQLKTQQTNASLAFQLVSIYLVTQHTKEAEELLDRVMSQPGLDARVLLSAAQAYAQIQRWPKLESTLLKLTELMPSAPEAWYDLATVQASLGKNAAAIASLKKAIDLNQTQRKSQPSAKDFRELARQEPRFAPFGTNAEFQKMVGK